MVRHVQVKRAISTVSKDPAQALMVVTRTSFTGAEEPGLAVPHDAAAREQPTVLNSEILRLPRRDPASPQRQAGLPGLWHVQNRRLAFWSPGDRPPAAGFWLPTERQAILAAPTPPLREMKRGLSGGQLGHVHATQEQLCCLRPLKPGPAPSHGGPVVTTTGSRRSVR